MFCLFLILLFAHVSLPVYFLFLVHEPPCPLDLSPPPSTTKDLKMLRVRPSEITLTQSDVDETRRRMAQTRDAMPAGVTAPSNATYTQASGLRRGPNYSFGDAVVRLGQIPVLKPRRVHPSLIPNDVTGVVVTAEIVSRNGRPDPPSPSTTETHPTVSTQDGNESESDLLLPVCNLKLQTDESSEGSALETFTPKAQPLSTMHSGDFSDETPPPYSIDPISKLPEDSLSTPKIQNTVGEQSTVLDLPQTSPVPSALHPSQSGYFISSEPPAFRGIPTIPQTEPRQRPNRPRPPTRSLSSGSDPSLIAPALASDQPRADLTDDVFGINPMSVRFEHGRGRGEDPRSTLNPQSSFNERIRRAHRRIASIEGRYHQFFSRRRTEHEERVVNGEAINRESTTFQRVSGASSGSSQPYSYYELPGSQNSSSSLSQSGDHLANAQYDGAASSSQISRGAYYSIRPSQVAIEGIQSQSPSISASRSLSPDLPICHNQHAVSPLPARPYERANEEFWGPKPCPDLSTVGNPLTGHLDATNAAMCDIPSPLELLEHDSASQLLRTMPPRVKAEPRSIATAMSTPAPHQRMEQLDSNCEDNVRVRSDDTSGGEIHNEDLQRERIEHDRNQLPRRYRPERPLLPPTYRWPELPPTIRPRRMAHPDVRGSQRSSENAPLQWPSQDDHIPSQTMQRNVSARNFHTIHPDGPEISRATAVRRNATPSQVLPQIGVPYTDPRSSSGHFRSWSNFRGGARRLPSDRARGDVHYSGSPRILRRSFQDGLQGLRQATAAPTRHPTNTRDHGERYPRRTRTSRHYIPRSMPEQDPFRRRQRPSDRGIFDPNMDHTSFSTPNYSTGGPRIPTRLASQHHAFAHHSDQENTGEPEAEMMRNELAAAGMRYGEVDGPLDVMDDTPPRVGRFEQRIVRN